MNYTAHTQQLTASLQELTARREKGRSAGRGAMPKTVRAGELVLSNEVASFLDTKRDYAAKTKKVSVGTY